MNFQELGFHLISDLEKMVNTSKPCEQGREHVIQFKAAFEIS